MKSAHSRNGKHSRMALVALAVTGALGAGAGAAAAAGTGGPAAAKATPATAAAHPAPQAAAQATGDKIDAGGGYTLWLTPEGVSVLAAGQTQPSVLKVSGTLPGKVSTQVESTPAGAMWSGIYRGPVNATTKVTITVAGRTLHTKVISLPGNPGWGAYYVFDEQPLPAGAPKPSVQVTTAR